MGHHMGGVKYYEKHCTNHIAIPNRQNRVILIAKAFRTRKGREGKEGKGGRGRREGRGSITPKPKSNVLRVDAK